jgi:hypothetical protein
MTGVCKGDRVSWVWGAGRGVGAVRSVSPRRTKRRIKGSEITRNGTKDDPALYIEQDDGDRVLKLASEVRRIGRG